MNFGKAFTFVFDDPDWLKKVAIPALVGLIPVIGQLVLIGWGLDTTRRVIRRDPVPLPDLDFGAQLGLGFKSLVVGLVYGIPAFLIYLPILIVPLVVSSTTSSNSDTASTLAIIVSLCCGGLLFLYALALALFLPAAQGNFLATDRLGAAFNLKEIFGLVRAAPGPYLMVLLGGVIGGVIAPLGSIACGVGALLTSAYALVMTAHLSGQAYNAATSNRAVI